MPLDTTANTSEAETAKKAREKLKRNARPYWPGIWNNTVL